MKPRTKQELAQLTKMNPGAFISKGNCDETGMSISYFCEYKPVKNKPLFERFYDAVGNFLHGNKSIAPAELKSFR